MLHFIHFRTSLLPHRDMETRLLPFVLDVDLPCPLMIEQHLPQDELEVILVHVRMRTRNLIITHVREIERGAVAMTRLRGGVDVSAPLQVFHILLRPQDRSHIETVMRQAVTAQYIRPLGSDSV